MAYTITLLNSKTPKPLKVRNGFTYNEEFNEKRDSGTLVVRTHGEELDIEPFDYILIEGSASGVDIVPKLMLVKSYSEEIVSFTTRIDREYTIEVMSQTKELERVTLPNLSITALPDGSHRSVWYYISTYLAAYAPVIKVDDTTSANKKFAYATKWTIDSNLRIRFQSIDCPEFSWNRPTLSEVLTDLMLVDNCLPCIRDNVLTFLDIGKKGSEIYKPLITRAVSQMDSEDYNADLAITMQNAIGTNPAKLVEYISFRNQSDGILTTNNMQIVTSKPIYNIKKVTMFVKSRVYRQNAVGEQTNVGSRLTGIDITPSVKEQSEFDVLDPTPKSINNDFDESAYKCFNVHYKRGGNTIEGWGTTYGYPFAFQLNGQEAVVVGLYVHYTGENQRHTNDIEPGTVKYEAYNVDLRDIFFEVEYESMGEIALKVGRKLPLRNALTSTFDNQGSSYVSVQQQSLFEYAKANRLSNKIWEISGLYSTETSVPKCGETFNGAVIFSRELQYYDDFVKFHGYATEDYVLSNYFVSVRAKRRSWAIASGNEALTRHDVNKVFLEFSHTRKTDLPRNGMNVESGALEFLSPFLYFPNDDSIKGCLFRSYDGANYYPSSSAYIGADYTVEAAGLSLAMTFEFSDNYQAGVRAVVEDGQYVNRLVPYCDGKGEFVSASVYFDRYVDPADGEFIWGNNYVEKDGELYLDANPSFISNDFTNRVRKARNKPIVGDNYRAQNVPAFSGVLNIHKDNREIISATFQYEYCADDRNIIVTDAFVRSLRVFHSGQDNPSDAYMIASPYILTTLPTAEERFKTVGFLFRDEYSRIRWAHTVYDDGQSEWIWAYEPTLYGDAFRYLNGYSEDASKEEHTLLGLVRYMNVLYLTTAGILVPYKPRSLKVALRRGRFPNYPKTITDGGIGYTTLSGTDYVEVSPSAYRVSLSDAAKTVVKNGVRTEGVKSFAIADANDNVLLAVNFPDDVADMDDAAIEALCDLYINYLSTRDYRVSKNVAEQQTYYGTLDDWERPVTASLRMAGGRKAAPSAKAPQKATGEEIAEVESIIPVGFEDA